jgi:hypothetical protein
MNWKEILLKVWKWTEHNRWTVIVPLLACVLWFTAIGCIPEVASPLDGAMVNADELKIEWETLTAQYELARINIEKQIEMQGKFQELVLSIASGGVADWSALAKLLMSGGFIGFALDNIRKGGVIGGLKRNKKVK